MKNAYTIGFLLRKNYEKKNFMDNKLFWLARTKDLMKGLLIYTDKRKDIYYTLV